MGSEASFARGHFDQSSLKALAWSNKIGWLHVQYYHWVHKQTQGNFL